VRDSGIEGDTYSERDTQSVILQPPRLGGPQLWQEADLCDLFLSPSLPVSLSICVYVHKIILYIHNYP